MSEQTAPVNNMEKQSALEHVLVLRRAVIRSLLFFALLFIAFLVGVRYSLGHFTAGHDLIMLGPLDALRLYLTVAGALALGFSAPYFLYEAWRFIKPALTKKEAKSLSGYIPAVFFCFLLGLSFGYFVVFPIVYEFLINLGQLHFDMMITAQEYFSFLLMSTIPIGFLFELPIVLMCLTSFGLFTPQSLVKARKYSYFALICASVLITPPDFFSDILVVIPFIILYEIGIILSRIVYRKKENMERELENTGEAS